MESRCAYPVISAMTPAGEILRDRILRAGPISFHEFMECALYHPSHGYYCRPASSSEGPFGAGGDYFTAEQIQPVFGLLVASGIRNLFGRPGAPVNPHVVELGAGRGEMAFAFGEWPYHPVEILRPYLPPRIAGLIFANEFFDALPVDLAVREGECFRERRVSWDGRRFIWIRGEPAPEAGARYLEEFVLPVAEGAVVEIGLAALDQFRRAAAALDAGFFLVIDYGYDRRELARFPAGTLLSYRRHQASDDVLSDPGERDITAHVNFTALKQCAAACGLRLLREESLAAFLLRAGEPDQFASVLDGADERESLRRRLQLKTLLFGMGETFRVLLWEK